MTNPTESAGSGAPPSVTLLTRAGCGMCAIALEQLRTICADYGVQVGTIDVDEAAATDPGLRAEYGDRLPVVLLNGREHSYFDVDEPRLRADLSR
ncbi:glutaredoxin family protein [Nocardia cyriacigeorgica]|uniref:glutaredoxin family protein n=1 Tax=Nocardia cyriacigeorgica TaxID=135487 RepID=UPI0013D644F4|nr:glutaredoxin family protein [Nocardia cyriacigeorgica]MBF6437246.1 glutaredoxin family protein [Nocardia cyriacigeorgica]MBF6452815.1 glutaredoxin family protein [Nocardia cyriacigeorgica]MBF6481570.1 glutaredoxin family protein [Nocardia cyriacigeorgica]MBF6549984.1 glutaredoxin family protein [Nocardia cyriacigeorgica]NEW25655.1 glutaredoxin family protein [Nocardia cyriacigeorgica]